uniref:Uncharacterized protein n=1 Tax=Streptomyces auratus AGR0001 TaxID=1160718 RepID=J2A0M0_9ACTN
MSSASIAAGEPGGEIGVREATELPVRTSVGRTPPGRSWRSDPSGPDAAGSGALCGRCTGAEVA